MNKLCLDFKKMHFKPIDQNIPFNGGVANFKKILFENFIKSLDVQPLTLCNQNHDKIPKTNKLVM